MAWTEAEAEVLKTFLAHSFAGKRLLPSLVASKSHKSKPCGFSTGEATTGKLPLGDAKFKMFLARPQQTTPFAALRACHTAGVPPSLLSPRH